MVLGRRVARDQANNVFVRRRVVTCAGSDSALAEPIEPKNSIGVHQDLNDGGISQRAGNRRPHRRTEHRAPAIRGLHVAHARVSMMFSVLSVRLPPAIWRPSWAMNRSKR